MLSIVAGHEGHYEGLAADLPDAEPDVADLVAAEHVLETFEAEQERIDATLVQLAVFGQLDELATRRHRRRISGLVQDTFVAGRGEAA